MCTKGLHEGENLGGEAQRNQLRHRQVRGRHTEGVTKINADHLACSLVHQIVRRVSVPDTCEKKQFFKGSFIKDKFLSFLER